MINKLPEDIINIILSYVDIKCYRCNKLINPINKIYIQDNYKFCSSYCCEYQHY